MLILKYSLFQSKLLNNRNLMSKDSQFIISKKNNKCHRRIIKVIINFYTK
jgi:hypothetical protein